MILHGGADELLRRRVYAEVKDLNAAALHHDADEILADVVHVALHGAEAHAAAGLGGGERFTEAVHADDHPS